MTKIIFLNGCGSSGKSSIARAIQHLSEEDWLTFGVDTFINMMPQDKSKFFSFTPGKNKRGPTMRVETSQKGRDFFKLMPEFAAMLASKGYNIIIDEVLLDDILIHDYINVLSAHKVYFVGILCDLKIMQEREILRGDRAIGLSNDQIDRVPHGIREYDLKVDTSNISPFDAARQILDFVDGKQNPKGFSVMSIKPHL